MRLIKNEHYHIKTTAKAVPVLVVTQLMIGNRLHYYNSIKMDVYALFQREVCHAAASLPHACRSLMAQAWFDATNAI
ncbi:hypothetical protein OX459_18770 [Janthinobacterium sp. SUN026]|uniref:hypothetical protein n=1 Tax=Janthinobacterium sp. SUN026 TaxID=3002438 RepID=UPI0025B0CA93|nr:hypothetical protein [Janthinobacterium sp. SUN026]MDN2673447.1 hypothetical protein [Janthinobacterium sp. SUN026]